MRKFDRYYSLTFASEHANCEGARELMQPSFLPAFSKLPHHYLLLSEKLPEKVQRNAISDESPFIWKILIRFQNNVLFLRTINKMAVIQCIFEDRVNCTLSQMHTFRARLLIIRIKRASRER